MLYEVRYLAENGRRIVDTVNAAEHEYDAGAKTLTLKEEGRVVCVFADVEAFRTVAAERGCAAPGPARQAPGAGARKPLPLRPNCAGTATA